MPGVFDITNVGAAVIIPFFILLGSSDLNVDNNLISNNDADSPDITLDFDVPTDSAPSDKGMFFY